MKYDEAKLWIAVIERAMKDAVGKNVKLKEEAIKWLNSESFETVCELADLDFKLVRDSLSQELKGHLYEKVKLMSA
ncbi:MULTISPECIES: hypothetical protein [unclassified Wolbachia]|uniref:hypothetical protein n=1 Tax=unclassified Wolbachia TaxID=2640676 RepID=UPI0031331B58